LFATLAGKSKDVTAELDRQRNSMGTMEEQYSNMAEDMGGTVGIVSSNSNSQNVNYNVDITATGDTPVSQDTAELVADNLADRINTQLGGKI
jgi:archaellum component FlaF (FlaF/FlaG flagellin family)